MTISPPVETAPGVRPPVVDEEILDISFLPTSNHTRTVVIAVDQSTNTDRTVQYALEKVINRDTDLVVLVHVRPIIVPIYNFAKHDYSINMAEDHHKAGVAVVQKYGEIVTAAGALGTDEFKVRGLLLKGDPRDEVISRAEALGADLIVVGSKGAGAFKRAVLGSVSDYIIHHAHTAVLVVKPEHHKHEKH
ncbi:hypothetical protein BDK51DRAFT_29081 [Blyttiomyces helicus]|uniref:UspA domain-containing protein n=1 Tax=Blyttiomyces helicus TaxID=388810 RepID=A0A4P9W6L9_9FUNG|nr:hypothetical protein BDK51DRAFT_29081 [Blyttiomyces helicus]|eukprot:RKO88109.1 hypothetical protein BDK51DRAFT_29081 [Blyttiomyces helicus]